MRTRLFLFFIVISATCSSLCAQPHSISVGLRAGAGTYLATGDLDNRLVANAMVDADYSWLVPVKNVQLGVTTGLSFGYTGGAYKKELTEQYCNYDYLGHPIYYTCSSSLVNERVNGFTMEIPAMFALRCKGLVLNAGLKLQVPIYYRYHQDLTSPTVRAYYPEYKVPVTSELITGKVPTQLNGTIGKRDIGDVSILLGFELGYEWTLNEERNDIIGLVGYFDGAPYSHSAGKHTEHVIDVAKISDSEYPVPQVTVNTILGTYAKRINYLDFGIKLYYRFNVLK